MPTFTFQHMSVQWKSFERDLGADLVVEKGDRP